ncbi:NAD(P)-binding domain-containing protein [Amycolatopsis jiangsuensis]
MTRALLAAGYSVTVWNHTPNRAEGVVAAGARLAATPAEAVTAGDLVILSLTDYRAMTDILGGATESLAGRTLVNLSSRRNARSIDVGRNARRRVPRRWSDGSPADGRHGTVLRVLQRRPGRLRNLPGDARAPRRTTVPRERHRTFFSPHCPDSCMRPRWSVPRVSVRRSSCLKSCNCSVRFPA